MVLVRTAIRMPGKNRAVEMSSAIKNISIPPRWVCRVFFHLLEDVLLEKDVVLKLISCILKAISMLWVNGLLYC